MALTKSVDFPGNVNLAGDIGGTFSGCKVAFIEGTGDALAANLNTYFSEVDINATYVREVVVPGGLLVFYTKHLDAEEIAYFDTFNTEVEEKMRQWRAQREEGKRKEAEKMAELEREVQRLTALGRQCEANHGAVLKARKAPKLKAVPNKGAP